MYQPIQIDRKNLTIMGVPFPDLETLDSTANAVGTNMFEGFEPTSKSITLIRDYVTDKITSAQFIEAVKAKEYV
ncbi:MAG: antitoxin VbhA family protein [Planctomycetaceae bacterium]|jgi:putative transcriptional regulator|nr:antitoxin VbhA family protein [Planctomycetaceae bacterium]